MNTRFNPLTKQTAKIKSDDDDLITANLLKKGRPSFAPTYTPHHATFEKDQDGEFVLDSNGNLKMTARTGFFNDLFVKPIKAALQTTVKTKRVTKKTQKRGGKNLRGSTLSESSSMYYFANNCISAVSKAISDSIPSSQRIQADVDKDIDSIKVLYERLFKEKSTSYQNRKESDILFGTSAGVRGRQAKETGEKVPVDIMRLINSKYEPTKLKNDVPAFKDKIRVKPEGDVFKIELPLLTFKFWDDFPTLFDPTLDLDVRLGVMRHSLTEISKRLKVNFLSEKQQEASHTYQEFKALFKENPYAEDLPEISDFMGTYFVSYNLNLARCTVAATDKLDRIRKEIKDTKEKIKKELEKDSGDTPTIQPPSGAPTIRDAGQRRITTDEDESVDDSLEADDYIVVDSSDDDFISDGEDSDFEPARVKASIEIVDHFSDTSVVMQDDNESIEEMFTELEYLESIGKMEGLKQLELFKSLMSRSITFSITVRMPKVEAQYFTQTHQEDIKPTHILNVFGNFYDHAWHTDIHYIMPLEAIAERNVGYEATPRTWEGFCAAGKTIYYIPDVNNLEMYSQLSDEALLDEDGFYSFDIDKRVSRSDEEMARISVSNYMLYTDWVNKKFSYTDQSGNIRVLDLETFFPVRKHFLLNKMSRSVYSLLGSGFQYVLSLNNIVNKVMGGNEFYNTFRDELEVSLNQYKPPESLGEENIERSFIYREFFYEKLNTAIHYNSSMSEVIKQASNVIAFELMAKDVSPDEFVKSYLDLKNSAFVAGGSGKDDASVETMAFRILRTTPAIEVLSTTVGSALYKTISKYVSILMSDVVKYASHVDTGVEYFLQMLAHLLIVRDCVPRYAEIREDTLEAMNKYNSLDVSQDAGDYEARLKNVSSDERYLKNFQWRALSILDKSPEFAILAVDAGGGKTICILSNIIQELQKGNIKKPLVVCPNHLVKDYVGEVVFLNDAKMNIIPINNDLFRVYGKDSLTRFIKNAPINTVFVTDYTTVSIGSEFQAYASTPIQDYRNLDIFKEAGFDGVWLDESHFIKNDSGRANAIKYAFSECKIKRLATGTLMPNRVIDIANQFSLFDPTVFGDIKELEALVESDPEGAALQVAFLLKSHCAFINVRRKEWAAELPSRVQSFSPIAELTPNQKELYNLLLKMTEEAYGDSITDEDLELKEELEETEKEVLKGKKAKLGDTPLAHIEMFLAAPFFHPFSKLINSDTGRPFLETEADKKSPKSDIIAMHYRDHMTMLETGILYKRDELGEFELDADGNKVIDKNFNGMEIERLDATGKFSKRVYEGFNKSKNKILVFTNYDISAAQFMRDLPADIAEKTYRYRASTKVDDFLTFSTEDKYQMMIGIGKSMNTGLNLQFCSRLIFTETMWTPGELEQSLARIFRPVKFGTLDNRPYIFLNHVLINRTLDVLKLSNLTAKWIETEKVMVSDAKPDDTPETVELIQRYKKIEAAPIIRLSKKTLFNHDFDITSRGYSDEEKSVRHNILAFGDILLFQSKENRDFARNNPNLVVPKPIIDDGLLEESSFISKQPYIRGHSLYGTKALNLVPYLEWKSGFIEKMMEEDPNYVFNLERVSRDLGGLKIHTSIGEGIAIKESVRKVGGKESESEDDERGEESPDSETVEDFSDFDTDDFDIDAERTEDDSTHDAPSTNDLFGPGGSDFFLDLMEQAKNYAIELTKDDSTIKAKEKKIRVSFSLDALVDLSDEVIEILKNREDYNLKNDTLSMVFEPNTIFVITDDIIDYKTVREGIASLSNLEKTVDIPFAPKGLEEKLRRKEEKLIKEVERIRNKKIKNDLRNKELEKEHKRKDRERDKQIDESKKADAVVKRKRGRPPKVKVKVDEVEIDDIQTNETETDVRVSVVEFAGVPALRISQNEIPFSEIKKMRLSGKEFDFGGYTFIPMKTKAKTRAFLDEAFPMWIGMVTGYSMFYQEMPYLKNPDNPQYTWNRAKDTLTNTTTGRKVYITPKDIEDGFYLESTQESPEKSLGFAAELESLDMLDTFYERYLAFGPKNKTIMKKSIAADVVALMRRLKKRPKAIQVEAQSPPRKIDVTSILRVLTMFKVSGGKGFSYLVVPDKNVQKAPANKFYKVVRKHGLQKKEAEEHTFLFYPTGDKTAMKNDLKTIKETYGVSAYEKAIKDIQSLVIRKNV